MKLKNINLGLGLMALLALSSCADDKFSEYRTDMTKNLKEYQYLNNYEPLKKYVEDMKASGKCNPDFKLGIALEAAEFNKQGLVYCLAGSNFNEMTAGNAMKMASCVKDDGSMDFSLVKEFVKNAKDADMTRFMVIRWLGILRQPISTSKILSRIRSCHLIQMVETSTWRLLVAKLVPINGINRLVMCCLRHWLRDKVT